MLQVMKMTTDPRLAVLADGQTLLITITSNRNKLVLQVPEAIGGQLRADLASLIPPVVATRPAPPRYKWHDLLRRLNRSSLTAADHDALRDLLFNLGVKE